MPSGKTSKINYRQQEITETFIKEVDKHLEDILQGKTSGMFETRDSAEIMHIDARHLSNTTKMVTGRTPCHFFEGKILSVSKGLLKDQRRPVSEIAAALTYDPSNFNRFFKKISGMTPFEYRKSLLASSADKF